MSAQVRWRARSRSDLLDIYLAIALDNKNAAQTVFDRLHTRVLGLADHPRLGPRRDEIRPGLRALVERPYLILYRTSPDRDDEAVAFVEIVRVVDGRRNLGRLLQG